jgi:CTP synthase (UTP-ammonia lyase)
MKRELRIGVVGDWKPAYRGHIATDAALRHGARAVGAGIEPVWLSTKTLEAASSDLDLEAFDGFFMTPGTPYDSLAGALRALRFARERGWPLLATCGGFQHLLLEVAINAAGISDGQHGDYGVTGGTPVIVRVACPVPNRAPGSAALSGRIRVTVNKPSQVYDIYGRSEIDEAELPGHPFFIGTLFQPQLSSTAATPHPIIRAFCVAAQQFERPGRP